MDSDVRYWFKALFDTSPSQDHSDIKILLFYFLIFFREGIVFENEGNKPTEHSLQNFYPYDNEESYIAAENRLNLQIDALISETSLTVPPHR